MEFGERMLKKYGWNADQGLGKDNQGMKAALKPVLKFDNRGVGCNQKDEYSSEFKWWEHSYNRAAEKIATSFKSEEKSPEKKCEDQCEKKKKKTIYSRFEKASILTGNKEESVRVEKDEIFLTEISSPMPTDEELLKICGGRTAHKFEPIGARHGIKMNGKLQRLQEQETRSQSSNSETNSVEEKKKKKKKRKLSDSDE